MTRLHAGTIDHRTGEIEAMKIRREIDGCTIEVEVRDDLDEAEYEIAVADALAKMETAIKRLRKAGPVEHDRPRWWPIIGRYRR